MTQRTPRRPRFSWVKSFLSRRFEPEFAQARAQRTWVQTQPFRRPLGTFNSSLALLQHPDNVVLLDLFEGRLTEGGWWAGNGIETTVGQREIQLKLIAGSGEHRPFEDIFQFPDITRPVVMLQLKSSRLAKYSRSACPASGRRYP